MNKLTTLGNFLWVAVTWALLTISPAQAADEIVYFHVDALGSATAAFNENGDLCWRQNYTPYGGQTSDEDASPPEGCGLIGKDRGYTGHVQDESGLTYMQQRYYDASIGRFLSIDPVGVNADDTRTYNRYSYAANNPYTYIDPDGEAFFLAAIPLIKAAAVFIAKEAAVEAASQLTGGATDLLSTRRAAKRGFIEARKLLDPKSTSVVTRASNSSKPDFIVESNGTAVRNSARGARKDLEAGGLKGNSTTETKENGSLHKGLPGRDGPMDVRIMDGQIGGGPFKGPRVRTTRSGTNDSVRTDGSRFRNNESKSQRLRDSHIHLEGR